MAEDAPSVPMTCEVCSEKYTDPLMLSCLHSFCKKCIIKAKEKEGSPDTSLKCPTCDTIVPLPDGKVENLTQNLWLAHESKEALIKKKIHNKEAKLCEECSVDDDSGVAVVFCCNCGQFLCNHCKQSHKRQTKKADHKLIDLDTKKEFEMPTIKHQVIYCVRHSGQELIYFCKDCDQLICRDCPLIKHKDHNIVESTDMGDTAREALKQSVSSCDGIIPPVNEAIANGEKRLQQIATRKVQVSKQIKKTFAELKAVLDKRCNDLIKDTEEIASTKTSSVEKQLDEFHKLVKQFSHGCRLASSVSERTDPGEVLSVKKLITNQLDQCLVDYKKLTLEIKENEEMFTRLNTTGIRKVISEFGGVFEADPAAYSIDSGLAIPLATVEKDRKFKVALPDIDKSESYIKASLIKCDGSKEEGRVDIVKSNNTATVSCTPQSIGQYELSLTIRGHHIKGSPYHLSVKPSRDYTTLTNKRSFNVVNNHTYGVAVHTNGEVFASSSSGFVQVFSEDGTPVRRIVSKGNGNGEFQSSRGLLLVGDRLYVSDSRLHRVHYFSATTGQYIGQFGCNGKENGQFSSPYGMSTDGKGYILVADYRNNRVQVFKEDGTFVQVIQCDGTPTDVAVDNEGKIHVTIENQNHVQVFSPDGKTDLNPYNPAGGFQHPQGIAIDDEGYIFITAQYFNGSNCRSYLHVLNYDRKYVKLLSGLNSPIGVTLDKDGHIYVAECNLNRISKY